MTFSQLTADPNELIRFEKSAHDISIKELDIFQNVLSEIALKIMS